MLVLLPPSEGKTPRRRGRPVGLDALSFPALTAARTEVLTALEKASASPDALELLGVGPSLTAEVERNTRLLTTPAVPVAELYSGVLYDALDPATLPTGARRRAASRLVVVSALWGALRPGDRVPPYRLSMDVDLPGVGPLSAFWRAHLPPVLDELTAGRLVVDCRSSTYAAAWRPAGGAVAVRVLRERDGRRSVVSHMAKHTRGLVVRHLLQREGRDPRTPEALARAVGEAFTCELGGDVLDVVVRD
ncbi:MAG: YaaA family protein [Actinomycetes bacterium]